MPSFFLTSSSQVSQVLSAGQTGFVAENVALFTLGTAAVSMTGSSRLDVFGTVGSNSVQALDIAVPTDDVFVTVGANGTLFSNLNAAIRGTLTDEFHLSNAGLISGGTEAIEVTAPAVSGTVSDFNIVNSGTIQSNGNLATHNTIEFVQPAGALVNIANAGLILNGGAGGAISVSGGRLDLNNSGTIQSRQLVTAITADLGNDVVTNTGTIIGGISLNEGSDEIANHGSITGTIILSNGSDRVVNTGTIIGFVNLADSLTTGAITDTVINAGLIVGDVSLGNGNDIYRSQGGRIEGSVFGGAGNDTYFVDQTDIIINDNAGIDTVRASVDFALASGLEELHLIGGTGLRGTGNLGLNSIFGGAGDDTLRGEENADFLFGNYGDDRLFGGSGNDTLRAQGEDFLRGGSGDDLLEVVNGDVTLEGGTGIDTLNLTFIGATDAAVNLGTGTATLGEIGTLVIADVENVQGGDGNDTITGSTGANRLEGFAGADRLAGGGGNDTLVGGAGVDTLSGGGGDDVFVFLAVGDSGPSAPDEITDFSRQRDIIDLSLVDVVPGLTGGAFVFIGTGAFTNGPAGEVRFSVAGDVTTVEVRQVGSSSANMVIVLEGQITLTADNFIL